MTGLPMLTRMLLLVAALIFAIALLSQSVVFIVIAVIIGAPICRAAVEKVACRKFNNAILDVVERHADALIRQRARLIGTDAYGSIKTDHWEKEIRYFIGTYITRALTARQLGRLETNTAGLIEAIDECIASMAAIRPAMPSLPDNATGADFELFCAQELRRAGWEAQMTKASGDQGVDVIAEKNGVRVVLQCKLYSRPVGNKAVQEAAAARAHERAHHAAVVSNNLYTRAAEQLARTNGVLLLHHSQLRELDALLAVAPN